MFEHSDYFPTVHCEDCDLKFESQNELEKHKANAHVFSSVFSFLDGCSEDKNFISEAGGETLKSQVKEKHVHKKRFYCSVCHHRVTCCRRYRLKLHIQQKHPEAELLTIGCSNCDKRVSHITCDKHGHFETSPTKLSSKEKVLTTKVQLQCNLCQYKAGWPKRLEIHMKNIHENIKQFACSLCHHATFFKANLEKHLKTHKNTAAKVCKIGCSLCDSLEEHKVCDSLGNFDLPKQKKQFQCEECNFSSDSQKSLNCHIDNVHEKHLRFFCNICDFKSFYKHHVKEHVTKVHGIEKDTKKLVGEISEIQNKFLEDSKPSQIPLSSKGYLEKSSKEKLPTNKVQLQCNLCQYNAGGSKRLDIHMKKVHAIQKDTKKQRSTIMAKKLRPKNEYKGQNEKKTFPCEECGISTKSVKNLKYHIDAVHNGVVRFICSICDFKSYNKFNVERHQSSWHEKEDADSVYVITHDLGIRKRADPHAHFSCNLCEKKSYQAITIRNHQLKNHKNEKVQIVELECGKCGQGKKKNTIKNKRKFNKTDDESSLKRNPCFVCNIDCSSHRERVSHYRREHPTDRIFNCNLCNYGSNFLGNFEAHEKKHEEGVGFRGRKKYKARILGEDLKENPCFVCSIECESHQKRVLHYRQEHPEEQIFKCGECPYGSNSPGSLLKHQSTHEVKLKTKYKCSICNIEFKGIGEKTIHYIKEHPSKKIYHCHLCGYGSNKRHNVNYHLECIHGVYIDRKLSAKPKLKCKEIKCKDCDQLFQTNRQLTIHYRVDHPDKRMFKCESCEYSSNYLPNMKTHHNSTHKQLVLSCSLCVFITTWNTTFHQHMRDKHGVFQKSRTRVAKYNATGSLICDECGFLAKTEKQMKNHEH